uniref:Uncharacterized protein n=1 Tax=Ditylenchus dipsaci TaxID=166011 RepID=A0A915DA19_9BILA
MAIFIEHKKRRPMLALYLLNLASESVFRQLVHRNYLQPIPHAQCLLFSIGLAYLFYATKQHDNTNIDLTNILNLTHGHASTKILKSVVDVPEKFERCLAWLRHQGGRHLLCTHHKSSCISNALEPAVRNFAFGVTFSCLIKIVSNLSSPNKILKSLMNVKLLQFPAFLAAMLSFISPFQVV